MVSVISSDIHVIEEGAPPQSEQLAWTQRLGHVQHQQKTVCRHCHLLEAGAVKHAIEVPA